MGVLIDASVLIAHERAAIDLRTWTTDRADEGYWISVVTASELLHGVHRAADAAIQRKRAVYVEGLLQRVPILSIDINVARAHARLWADLARAGELIGAHDLWLAASALAHGLVVVTHNLREFGRVKGLAVERWS